MYMSFQENWYFHGNYQHIIQILFLTKCSSKNVLLYVSSILDSKFHSITDSIQNLLQKKNANKKISEL